MYRTRTQMQITRSVVGRNRYPFTEPVLDYILSANLIACKSLLLHPHRTCMPKRDGVMLPQTLLSFRDSWYDEFTFCNFLVYYRHLQRISYELDGYLLLSTYKSTYLIMLQNSLFLGICLLRNSISSSKPYWHELIFSTFGVSTTIINRPQIRIIHIIWKLWGS